MHFKCLAHIWYQRCSFSFIRSACQESVQFFSVLHGWDTWPSSQFCAGHINISVHPGGFCHFLLEETQVQRSCYFPMFLSKSATEPGCKSQAHPSPSRWRQLRLSALFLVVQDRSVWAPGERSGGWMLLWEEQRIIRTCSYAFSSPTENLVQGTLLSFISISVLCPQKQSHCSHETKGKVKPSLFLMTFFSYYF